MLSFRSLLVGFYPWVLALFFGGILLDISYANLARQALGAGERAAVFAEASDLLLLLGFVAILAAVGAIASTWESSTARNLFVASLLLLGFEFFIPALIRPFIATAQDLDIGPWLRIIPTGLASILAFVGLSRFYAHA